MGKPSRDKGNRRERQIVNRLRSKGIPARRVPLSGATEYAKGDVQFIPLTHCRVGDNGEVSNATWSVWASTAEVKGRKQFPAWLLEWLGENDCLFLVADRAEPLVVLRMDKFEELIR